MSGVSIERPEGDKNESFIEVEDLQNPEDSLIDELEKRIQELHLKNEISQIRLNDLYKRLELADKSLGAQRTKFNDYFIAKLRAAGTFLLVVIFLSAFLNISAPDVVEKILRNSFTLPALGASLLLAVLILLLPKQRRSLEDTFLDIDREFSQRSEKAETSSSPRNSVVNVVVNGSSDSAKVQAADGGEVEGFPKQTLGAGSDFEFCISEIVDYLGDHIKLAESKASKLLDKGTTYLRRGLYFYIGSIVVWQVWGHFVSFDGLVIAGMISTSIAFIIIEFLAAWFLKQYRSFVDSSMAYMRVQSFFNRYLLLYFAARDFGDDEAGDNLARSELLKVVSQEIKWPELKDINANDFNYMIEAMGSMHTSFEKLKGVFQSSSKKKK